MQKWIALMGRRDEPTDGVADYCAFLATALSRSGVGLEPMHVSWDRDGWLPALRKLRRESKNWRGNTVLVQYTGMAWSRRGFPIGVAAVVRMLSRHDVRCVVVFHEYKRQSGSPGWIDRIRGACQDRVIRALYRAAAKAIFTVPLENVDWLPPDRAKAHFIPIGANVPERPSSRQPADADKTVVVFGVTGAPNMASEVETIAASIRHAAEASPNLRLVLCGRGSSEAGKLIEPLLRDSGAEVIAKGVLEAHEIATELESADACLCVRGPITLQRGSALAGIACGVPIIGYRNGSISPPLDQAGIRWAPLGDSESLARNLAQVLGDSRIWTDLHQRNLRLQQSYFSWNRIAGQYLAALSQ
ncbi:MAG TPA: glycosyltransferase [Candidatus Acidoferrales bacterium]|nr:glycosyltransferase [Candidatus Acidoferrales bacterium]